MAMNDPKDLFRYWIQERWDVLQKREAGFPKPWSKDPIFQQVYFCNVRREDDRVTKWIRDCWSPREIGSVNYEFCMILARFLNWPDTLSELTDLVRARPDVGIDSYADEWFQVLKSKLDELAELGKVWGNAYVITTHGIPMGKAQYLVENVLRGAYRSLHALRAYGPQPTLQAKYEQLKGLEGLGSFLAAQVVADLKNTVGHPLREAEDWWTFVAPGPGSLRGLSWYFYGIEGKVTASTFQKHFDQLREELVWPTGIPEVCNQDLQNALCEFSKYMKVKMGTGRSKRYYNGIR